ncbi:hypothetical protein BATDEDRAFT_88024 [Batrachochytrium dendrobatidis JAM81]|uniref:Conserved oligomeric Golgi complex subunit 2 n=1 Tax=Batrachochytrium dendrobatidis (strain JAM81 / FGSC 10211) TaxID=684364 RepID=F4P172_BATDJ|nr:uncharacterized protein BATDEDRAFT_88024 [Batrachochytrium dendrobatidis JAM81]EGF80950.1 hypothetical protein BATDEDRAFT_88024 [Batrachochytrium dendrobatidis JAM81]|eukprot:XP_006678760.1 hypothetical protein BATDEDRAFT_88024 [Batrachochytrium dendrobatidis JAM81]
MAGYSNVQIQSPKENTIQSPQSETNMNLLAFNRQDFLEPQFAAADFVAARKHIPIDQLKHDFHSVLKALKGELVELINNDYAKVIGLSTNLVGVDSMISDLKQPILNIRTAVENVQAVLDEMIDRLETGLEKRALVRTKKAALEVFLNIHQSLEKVQAVLDASCTTENNGNIKMDEMLVERVAIEYNQLQYLVSSGQSLAFVSNISWKIEGIKNTLVSTLSGSVRQAYLTISTNPSDSEAASSLFQSLRVFVLIDRVADALSVFNETILDPFIQKNINPESVELMPAVGSTGRTLECLRIYTITLAALKNTQYDLLADIIWTGIIKAIISRLPIVFNAGIPDVFHRNYQTCIRFVQQFELLSGSTSLLRNLRNQESYIEFMRKWQLSIYYQIRHNEIAARFETGLVNGKQKVDTTDSLGFQLQGTQALSAALLQCWEDNVYLDSLSFRFWRLTLLLIRRYASWIEHAISNDMALPTTTLDPNLPPSTTSSSDMISTVILSFYSDIIKIRAHILKKFETHILPKLPSAISQGNQLSDSLFTAISGVESFLPAVTGRIVANFANKCAEPLRSGVKHLPRLYRSTNHETPTRCSYFIPTAFKPLTTFINANYKLLDKPTIHIWQQEVTHAVSQQYLDQVKETIASVKQIEESLKRFKKAKKPAVGGSTEETVTDDDKIRLQIQLDIEQYGKELSQLGLNPQDDPSFEILKKLDLGRSTS